MASNQRRLIRRVIERDARGKLVFNFGIFEARTTGDRQLISIVEGSYTDAQKLLKSERTESGNTFKGFKRLKTKEVN